MMVDERWSVAEKLSRGGKETRQGIDKKRGRIIKKMNK